MDFDKLILILFKLDEKKNSQKLYNNRISTQKYVLKLFKVKSVPQKMHCFRHL